MSAQSGQPFQTNGFNTSIDLVRRQAYPHTHNAPPPLAGHKRPPESLSGADDPPSKASTYISYQGDYPQQQKQQQQQHNSVAAGSNFVGFSRPSVGPTRGCLVASEIRPVTAVAAAAAAAEDNNIPNQHPNTGTGEEVQQPVPSRNPSLSLKDSRYGLPPSLVANFAALGVSSIYGWQASCLLAPGLLTGHRHLVYTAPTGGGKSLVADVLMLKRIIEKPSRKAILVLPYVALVQEKLKWLRRIVQDVEKYVPDESVEEKDSAKPAYRRWKAQQREIRVTGFFGGNRTTASWADTDIAVCTIEKVDPLFRVRHSWV